MPILTHHTGKARPRFTHELIIYDSEKHPIYRHFARSYEGAQQLWRGFEGKADDMTHVIRLLYVARRA